MPETTDPRPMMAAMLATAFMKNDPPLTLLDVAESSVNMASLIMQKIAEYDNPLVTIHTPGEEALEKKREEFIDGIVEKYGPGPHVFQAKMPTGGFRVSAKEELTRAEQAEEAPEMR